MVDGLDGLAEYEAFLQDVPKELREAIVDGLEAPEIYNKYGKLAAIRMVQIAMTEQDSGKAIAAIKDIMDRNYGKATERKQIEHKFEGLSDDELDAIVLSELGDE